MTSFQDYLRSLTRQSAHPDPSIPNPEGERIREAMAELYEVEDLDTSAVAEWLKNRPHLIDALGLVVGLTQEKLNNELKAHLGTGGRSKLARESPAAVADFLNSEFDLVQLLTLQMSRSYDFADVLIARAGTRLLAQRANRAGRSLEDDIESIAKDLGLQYATRGRFVGRGGQTAPFDLAIPAGQSDADIVVAAKAFDSTGSKLTDAVREIQEMASVRRPKQFVFAVVDGIGWHSRQADLQRIFKEWEDGNIDGLYSRSMLRSFRADLMAAATRVGLLKPDDPPA